jgi:hypothetical protein
MSYVGRDFSPAEQVESRQYGLDLVNDISEGETLTAAAWELIVREGVDPDPNSHLVGSPALVTPDGTTAQTATTQRIAGLLPDVLYTVRAIATTSLGNTVSVWTHISGEPVE